MCWCFVIMSFRCNEMRPPLTCAPRACEDVAAATVGLCSAVPAEHHAGATWVTVTPGRLRFMHLRLMHLRLMRLRLMHSN